MRCMDFGVARPCPDACWTSLTARFLSVTLGAALISSSCLQTSPGVSRSQNFMRPPYLRPHSHATGNLHAPVTVVEFGDLECPVCKVQEKVVHRVLDRYHDRICFVFRQFPLTAIHENAEISAEATECAAEQGEFWPYLLLVYSNQNDLEKDSLRRYAQDLRVDSRRFTDCLGGHKTASIVREDAADGRTLGVIETPTFFVNGQRHVGFASYEEFRQAIESALSKSSAGESGW